MSVIADTAGPIGLALRGLAEPDRVQVWADVEDSLRRFATEDGYELPAVALCAVASSQGGERLTVHAAAGDLNSCRRPSDPRRTGQRMAGRSTS